MKSSNKLIPKAHVIAIDMGYGHQRATYPLKFLAYGGKIRNADNYPGIPSPDKALWQQSRRFYEFISRFKNFPVLGDFVFNLYDKYQRVAKFYPLRDQSQPTIQLRVTSTMLKKKRWGEHFIKSLRPNTLPLVTSFFVPAFMAEEFNYPGDIYCLICDTDISRAWVARDPQKSRIKYLAPCERIVERLKQYGVRQEQIFLTGFPLPLENLGDGQLDILREDLKNRLVNLDPNRIYYQKYEKTIREELGGLPVNSNHVLTIAFAVGGAGSQRELGLKIIDSLKSKILDGQIRVNLIAGTHSNIADYYRSGIEELNMLPELDKGIKIICGEDKAKYFQLFNENLRTTDILWTKPSELSFYCALGLPIIMSEPIGSQEDFNRHWLFSVGAATDQEDVRYANEWLFDLLKSGWLAEAAMQGYFNAPKMGTFNIEQVLRGGTSR